ncbi:hypothetical protein TcasGA2_TC013741 [Tribolium castaneum]|uniref:Vitellogenin domain-containing protein n=1 Tax=Tribolium castaneum TaxID=7070 RepID=D6WJX6_TRICA|nr:hypothetical protein TcasGA2_TC013741 [Tribolium castaneum]
MGLKKFIVVFVALATISTSHAFIHLTPHDKEVVYTWKALVKAGTDLPTSHASQFVLEGKIHLQSNPNATHVRITDLTYKLYNGILDHVREHEAHSVPVQIHDLEHAFRVVYDTNGLAIGIATNGQEKEFSRNIKKALATILQMDGSVVKNIGHHHQHPHSFVTREHSIYGRFDVDYTVRSLENGRVEVHKLHDMHDSRHLYQHLFSNNEAGHCDAHYENPIMHDSRKDYLIVIQDGHHIVKHVQAVGALVYHPFKAQSDHQFILVNQSLHLHHVGPIHQQLHVESEHFEDHLTYHPFEDQQDGRLHDLTNGRHVVNYDKVIPDVQHMLEDIHQYLHEDHIHTREPDSKRGQLINRVQRLLQHFNSAKLEELHKKLTGEAARIFHHILPLVGTRASVLYIKHLVVDKVVHEDVAVDLLQHFPEHVVEPTIELLTQLETLIHLDENVHWDVRRAALLSFAHLVHHSHIHQHTHDDAHTHDNQHIHDNRHTHDDEQPYEKYVVEYINKLRSAHDYRTQMVYAFGLSNMKLHSIIKHMLPAVNGEWYNDHHFRLLSLWAMGSAVVRDHDPSTVIETLWPIFTNVDETTEMRCLAFFHIMESRPSDPRIANMYSYLINEPNEEVYRFVHSYMHTVSHSHDPCKEDFWVRMAHLVNFLPPPDHGTSSVHFHDYRDINFGFSGGVQEYFINSNESQIYGVATTTEHFNIHHEGYSFYLKIHRIRHRGAPIPLLFIETFMKKLRDINNNDLHIELVVFRHGRVINTHFFDEQNWHELDAILDFFTKDSKSLMKDLLHVSYDEYHRALIPTDLGIPAVWEYLMPVVHKNNISVTKETAKKVINIHVDNRYVNWIHYRHGLSFYNPIVDVWQGINRFHSYDAVWPLHFDISINTQQQSLQLSWKRHNNAQLDVAGLRSHVKQMVFIKDDHHRNVLGQSSPQCKEFVIVGHGKQFRHDYPLLHDDDLSTGLQWHVAVYDSDRYVTNGSFQHLLHLFTQSHHRHSETPLSHVLTSWANWHQYVLLLPRSGTYGFITRIEPSHQHPVSNIDLSLRLHSEPASEETHYYAPRIKWSSRVTYAVKNHDTSLKTWDVNAIFDINPGHTVNNLKMIVTRIVPGQNDYKICVDGVKKWTDKGVTGHLNVAMSQTPDGKCVKDDTVIDVTMTGEKSHEQQEGHHKYGTCEYISPYSVPHWHTLECLVDHTTVRRYVYNVKTTNVPSEFKKVFAHWWDHLKGYYVSYYHLEDEHNDHIGDHNLRLDIHYPMEEETVNVHVTTPQHVYSLTGVPTHHWRWVGLSPDSVEYSKSFQYLHDSGWVDHCVVHVDHHRLNQHDVHETVPNDWTLFVGNGAQNPTMGVYIKRVANDEIAVRVVDNGHTLEIAPHGITHQITVDGRVVPVQEYHHEDWAYWHVFNQDYHHPVAVLLHHSGLHLEYHHHEVVVVVPKLDHLPHGHCYRHH